MALSSASALALSVSLQLDVEHLALADRADAVEAEAGQRMLDRLALRIEHAVLEGDGDAGLDHAAKAPVHVSKNSVRLAAAAVAGGDQHRAGRGAAARSRS